MKIEEDFINKHRRQRFSKKHNWVFHFSWCL